MSEKTFYIVMLEKGNDSYQPAMDLFDEMYKQHHLRVIADVDIHDMMESISDECCISFNNYFNNFFHAMPIINGISKETIITVCGNIWKEDITLFKISLHPITNSDEIRLVRKNQFTNNDNETRNI